MSKMSPTSMSWPITTSTIFREEVEHFGLDDDILVIEQYDQSSDSWYPYNYEEAGFLRLTLTRTTDEGDD